MTTDDSLIIFEGAYYLQNLWRRKTCIDTRCVIFLTEAHLIVQDMYVYPDTKRRFLN